MAAIRTTMEADIAAIQSITMVPAILEVICRSTGMGFTAIARVTSDRWVACSVRDEIRFGLMPGGELQLDTTICNEIRQSGDPVIIDHVREDDTYHNHHTPATYGFQSYISVPIAEENGRFWGTLCAIDPKPSILNNTEIVGMFRTYANLISFYLTLAEQYHDNEVEALEAKITAELTGLLQSLPDEGMASVNKKDALFANVIRNSAQRIEALVHELKSVHSALPSSI